jgi:O-antigen/teichoic acid export membrane protein
VYRAPRVNSSLTLAAASVMNRVLAATWVVLLARVLDVKSFGTISLALAVMAVTQILADTGLSLFLTQRIGVRGVSASIETVRSALRLQILVAGSIGTLLSIGFLITHSFPFGTALAVGVGVVLSGMTQISRGILRGSQRFFADAALQTASAVGVTVVTFAVRDLLSVSGAMWIYVACQAPGAFAVPTWTLVVFRHVRATPMRLLTVLKDTAIINVFGTFAASFTRVDVLLLGLVAPRDLVAQYAASLQVFYGLSMTCGAAALTIAPRISRAAASRATGLRRAYLGSLRRYSAAGLACSCFGTVLAVSMPSIFGSAYERSIQPLLVMAMGLVVIVPGYVSGQFLIAFERQSVLLWSFGAALILAVPVYYVGYQIGGIVGVAVGMTLISIGMSIHQGRVVWTSVQ